MRPTWPSVEVFGDRVWLPEGVHLDLGAVGKAFAADLVAHLAATITRAGVLVSLGGDIATGGVGPQPGWQVLIQDRPDDAPLMVSLANGLAIATSSTEHRRAQPADRTTAHLLDPGTGFPVRGPWRTATVVAPSCVTANTYAAGAIVLGDRAAGLLTAARVTARLVTLDGRVFELGGFPRELAA